MKKFLEALTSDEKNSALPEEFDYFGKLIGSWKIDYVDACNSRAIKGEWHFSRILEGMAIQDVIVLWEHCAHVSLSLGCPRSCKPYKRIQYRAARYCPYVG